MLTVINNQKNGSQENRLTFLLKIFCQEKKTTTPKNNEHPVEEMAKPIFFSLKLLYFVFF